MISYQTGPWHFGFIFRLKGSVFPKALVWSIPAAALSASLTYFLEPATNINVSQVWVAYNFTLGFLIVFRTQQGYSRFWEGSNLLQQIRAEWFNAISSCFAFCSVQEDKRHEVRKFQHLLVRLASLLHCTAMQEIAVLSDEAFEVLDLDGISVQHLSYLSTSPDKPLVILQWIQKLIVLAQDDKIITAAPPILSRVYQELSRGIVNVGSARKITDIQFPFPYAQMVTVTLIVSTVLVPVINATLMSSPLWTAILTFLSVFAFWCINYIAAEIEMPFGEDENDLPIALFQESFNVSLRILLDSYAQTPPNYDFNPTKEHTAHARGLACPFELITCMRHNILENNVSMLKKAEHRSEVKRRKKTTIGSTSVASRASSVQTEKLRATILRVSRKSDALTTTSSARSLMTPLQSITLTSSIASPRDLLVLDQVNETEPNKSSVGGSLSRSLGAASYSMSEISDGRLSYPQSSDLKLNTIEEGSSNGVGTAVGNETRGGFRSRCSRFIKI